MAFDSVQHILAVGTKNGSLRMYPLYELFLSVLGWRAAPVLMCSSVCLSLHIDTCMAGLTIDNSKSRSQSVTCPLPG